MQTIHNTIYYSGCGGGGEASTGRYTEGLNFKCQVLLLSQMVGGWVFAVLVLVLLCVFRK